MAFVYYETRQHNSNACISIRILFEISIRNTTVSRCTVLAQGNKIAWQPFDTLRSINEEIRVIAKPDVEAGFRLWPESKEAVLLHVKIKDERSKRVWKLLAATSLSLASLLP